MSERDRRSEFLNFMRMPDGSPLATIDILDYLTANGFFVAPASTKHHGNYEGGLFDHSLSVAKHLVGLTESLQLKWTNCRSPYLVGIFHDLCKIDHYKWNFTIPEEGKIDFYQGLFVKENGRYMTQIEYNSDTLLKGHGDKSVMLLSQFYTLTEEEVLCIRYHMGAFTEKSEWNDYTRAVRAYPNVLWTHQADMLASHVEGV